MGWLADGAWEQVLPVIIPDVRLLRVAAVVLADFGSRAHLFSVNFTFSAQTRVATRIWRGVRRRGVRVVHWKLSVHTYPVATVSVSACDACRFRYWRILLGCME
jgi:hypothetical protein